MTTEHMLYRRYKTAYADCATVPGSYDATTKSIAVLIPDGRKKPSGTRGQSFRYMEFHGVETATGRAVCCTIKATCRANAIKRLPSGCTWDLA